MTDDLKERLLDNAEWGDGEAADALAHITDLEARLAAAEAEAEERHALHLEQVRITNDWIARTDSAEAEEDALAEALRKIANCGQSAEPDHWKFRCMAREKAHAALAAYEARRKG